MNLPFYKQWVRLTEVKKAITNKQSDLQTLGLGKEAARVVRWIDLYGSTLGVTQAVDTTVDQLAVAVDGWHKAWEDLTVAVLYRHKDDEEVRTKLLAPYERVAEMERAEARKRRAKRKADNEGRDE